jgi:hypothetical protein
MINMICLYVLVAWGCLAVISLVTDGIVIYRTLAGRNGAAALALFRDIAARHGGIRRWVARNLVLDIVEPWLIWQAMLSVRRSSPAACGIPLPL